LKGNVAKTFLRLKADESAVVALLKRSMGRKESKDRARSQKAAAAISRK
jgi:hypothetical protein